MGHADAVKAARFFGCRPRARAGFLSTSCIEAGMLDCTGKTAFTPRLEIKICRVIRPIDGDPGACARMSNYCVVLMQSADVEDRDRDRCSNVFRRFR